jgi:hypothetical protein
MTIYSGGENFGSKAPAAPLLWDDGESKTVNSKHAVMREGGWAEAFPNNAGEPPNGNSDYDLQYRNVNFAPVRQQVPGPHPHSTTYLAGGHKEHGRSTETCRGNNSHNDFNDGTNVGVTIHTTSHTIFAMWYYRLDPDWPDCGWCRPNHKISVKNGGNGNMYDRPYYYINYLNTLRGRPATPCSGSRSLYLKDQVNACGRGTPRSGTNNPKRGWVHMEARHRFNDSAGFTVFLVDNVNGLNIVNCDHGGPVAGYSMGGFYRYQYYVDGGANCCESSGGQSQLHDSAFRYFDDLYIDTTMARVMLANDANYRRATIVEPQIPLAWSTGRVSVTVNLGRFKAGDSVYLFVFDSKGNHNPQGYQIGVGGS